MKIFKENLINYNINIEHEINKAFKTANRKQKNRDILSFLLFIIVATFILSSSVIIIQIFASGNLLIELFKLGTVTPILLLLVVAKKRRKVMF